MVYSFCPSLRRAEDILPATTQSMNKEIVKKYIYFGPVTTVRKEHGLIESTIFVASTTFMKVSYNIKISQIKSKQRKAVKIFTL
jgi:hypothetical protein